MIKQIHIVNRMFLCLSALQDGLLRPHVWRRHWHSERVHGNKLQPAVTEPHRQSRQLLEETGSASLLF